MKKLFPLLALVILGILLSSCAQDPWKAEQIEAQAKADQIAAQSLQESLNQELERKQSNEMHAFVMQEEARKQSRKDAIEPTIHNVLTFAAYSGFTLLLVGFIFVGRKTVVEINRVQEGFATAMIAAVDLRSRLIALDPITRQYPLIYQYNGHGRYLVTDINKKITMELDTRNEGDAQMIAGSMAIQHTGLLSREAGKPFIKDSENLGLLQKPPIIEATAFDIKSVARELVRKGRDE